MLYFRKLYKDGAQPRKFLKNRTICHYLENISTNILKCYCMLIAKFKDFSFMQNQRLLKTFGRH